MRMDLNTRKIIPTLKTLWMILVMKVRRIFYYDKAVMFICVELLGDLLRNKPTLDTSQDTLVVIDNAPKVKPELMEKLKRILRKVVGKFGTILSEYYPVDENNVFKGYVCVCVWVGISINWQ